MSTSPAARPSSGHVLGRWGKGAAGALTCFAMSVTGAALSADAAAAPPSGSGVCDGLPGCRVKARADVNGDGTRDVVAIARRGKNGAPDGAVIVRVKTGPSRVVSTVARTEFWYGPPWQGVADLDGRKGKEVVVGRTVGAHAQVYRALTWRQGGLVTLDAPGRGRYWFIDSALRISAGWQQLNGDPAGTIRRRVATRAVDSGPGPFEGRITTFKWSRDGWKNLGTQTIYPMTDERAYRWGGFRIPGLHRW